MDRSDAGRKNRTLPPGGASLDRTCRLLAQLQLFDQDLAEVVLGLFRLGTILDSRLTKFVRSRAEVFLLERALDVLFPPFEQPHFVRKGLFQGLEERLTCQAFVQHQRLSSSC